MSGSILPVVFLISSGVLVFEISLIRIFSVLMRYHFVFLVVSMSMCGFGAGGLIAFYLQKKNTSGKNFSRNLFGLLVLTCISMPLSIILLFKTPLKDFLIGYTVISFIPFVPFLFAGAFFAYVFELYAFNTGRLYFADLVGAGIGCIGVLWLLKVSGGINTGFLAGAIVALSSVFMGIHIKSKNKVIISGVCFFGILICVLMNHDNNLFRIPYVKARDPSISKPLFTAVDNEINDGSIVYTEWNAFARTDVVEFSDIPDVKYIYTDGDVPTTMHFFDRSNKSIETLKNTVFYLPFADLKNPDVLSIGPGGGVDILVSILGGSKSITGVEVNPSMFSIMERYAHFNGNLYRYPGVSVFLDDGRSFVKRCLKRYDLIYLALTQTATGQTPTSVLTEGYIHTKQAFMDYFEKLSNKGMLVFITQDELLLFRGLVTVLTILNKPHSPGLEKIMVFMVSETLFETTPYRYVLIAENEKFSQERLKKIKSLADKIGLITVFAPGLVAKPPFDSFKISASPVEIIEIINSQIETPINLFPVYDDKPFFLDLSFGVPVQVKKLLLLIICAVILCGIFAVKPVYRKKEARKVLLFFSVYFAILGLSYMLIEISMIQKFILFLGHPTYAVSVILFSLLAGNGIGSFTSQFWKKNLVGKIMVAGLLIGVIIGFYIFTLSKILDVLLFQTRFVRTLISIALVLPAGFLMGVFFPSGIRILSQYQSHSIPWMWAINGLLSVCGSIVAMVIGKIEGFTIAFAYGGLGYILVFLMVAAAKSKRLNIFTEWR